MNADPYPSVCHSSPNARFETVGSRLTVSWPRSHDSASSTEKCDLGNKRKPAGADPFYHSFNTEKQELLDLKLQIVRQKANFDKLSSRLNQYEIENKALKAEKTQNMRPMQMLIDTNQKLVAENTRLRATLQDYTTSSDKDEQVIKTLQKENELLRQQQQLQLPKEPSASSASETTITAPGIRHFLDSMDEDSMGDDCSTLPTLDSSHSCRNREYINMLMNDISSNDWLDNNNNNHNNIMGTPRATKDFNMEPTSTTINRTYLPYLPRSNRRNSTDEPVEDTSLASSHNDASTSSCTSSKARESRFDIRRLCSSLTDRSIISSSRQSDDLLVDFCKGPRSQQDTALSLRWSFKS